jgi:hypothetical protein
MYCPGVNTRFAVLCLVLLLSCAAAAGQSRPRKAEDEALTNASVVKLVRAGFKEKTVVSIINSRPARFDLTPDGLVGLKREGVPERVILAMLSRGDSGAFAGDDWDDDAFFGGTRSAPIGEAGRTPQGGDPGEVNIFGSSGGSQGRTRTRGGGDSVEGDTQTTGSATVRIIAPPSEDGGAPRLEKTPTLTDESVVDMVEAGFSDGTIIRQIERSPVDFDLSDAKLEGLRRRRVSEPVIAAMKSAMTDAPAPSPRPQR